MKIHCLIVEDEIPNAQRLQKLLAQSDFELRVSEVLATIKDSVQWLQSHPQPDLLLLDIHLADGNSFEIFKQVAIDSPVIFITAYDEYALQAFQVNSIDYLLKPIQLAELNRALHKFAKQQIPKPEDKILSLLGSLGQKQVSYRSRFLVSFREQYISLSTEQVAYCYSQNKITYLLTHQGERYVIDFSLERLESELSPKDFFRASRQLIISQSSIKKLFSHFNGKIKLELQPPFAEELLLSREKSAQLKRWLDG